MTTWKPADVRVVRDNHGAHIEPPLESGASHIERLRWRTGVIKAITGVEVDLNDGSKLTGPGYSYEYPEVIGIVVHGSDGGASSISQFKSEIWNYLNGIEQGAIAVWGRRDREEADDA